MTSIKPHPYFLNQSLKILFVNLMHAYFLFNRQCSQKPYAEQAPLKNTLNCREFNGIYIAQIVWAYWVIFI